MNEAFIRQIPLIGEDGYNRLTAAKVVVFGGGGVGGVVIEALARCGVGAITVVDGDGVDVSNLNRQILATVHTVGRAKAEVAVERVLSINPSCSAVAKKLFYTPNDHGDIVLSDYDYVIDCIDTVTSKLDIAEQCYHGNIKLISCMGTGNKLNPEQFTVADIYSTSGCPLCKVMRRELKARGIDKLTVLYSPELPVVSERPPASIAFCPPVAGYIIASAVVKELICTKKN